MDYSAMNAQLQALIDGVPYETANLANVSALIWQQLPDLNWAGFYKMIDGKLVLGPFQGKPACIEIPVGRGVCGTAVEKNAVIRVENVHDFPGHIACDSASNSEIVLPLYRNGQIWGVLDIDSPVMFRFTQEDESGLRETAQILNRMLDCAE